jgi:hypothetical protein
MRTQTCLIPNLDHEIIIIIKQEYDMCKTRIQQDFIVRTKQE